MRRSATTRVPAPTFRLLNRQRREAVPLAWLGRFARDAARALRLAGPGEFVIAFVDAATMRRVHGTFLRRRTMTDVLTFRYGGSAERRRSEPSGVPEPEGFRPVVGEIVIAPTAARAYAAQHGLSYRRELARYVAHGLLHWLGHEDRTAGQQHHMHLMEDRVLSQCGMRNAE
jgi:probable rRNA maturation factor